ncbi:MAG: MFS transporter [Deltaproteobacteria bacterium]|nr:MFS transporter [Deltaproteobacteria bacterium]
MIRNRTAIVALLTGLNFLNYLDRFIVAAVLPRIQDDLVLSNFEGGLLATVFLLGYFLTSPLFGKLGDRVSRKRLIAFGVMTWSAATIASGLATDLTTLILARIAVGVGEASYATLAPTIIDDISPPEKKGKMLAIFFLAVPVGSALGYLMGGYIQGVWGWRAAFFVGGGPGIVLAFVVLLIHEPVRTHLSDAKQKLSEVIATLFRIPLYRRAVFGYCAHTAAIGAFSFWAPTFLSARFFDDLSQALPPGQMADIIAANTTHWWFDWNVPWAIKDSISSGVLKGANFWFGVVTVVAGAIGTIVGGRMADRAIRGLPPVPEGSDHTHVANRMAANAQLRVCAIGVMIAFPMTAAAFFVPSAWMFFAIAGLAEIGLFLSTAPINAIMLRTAPVFLRASAMATAIFAIHLFGDLWSPSLVGLFLDHLPITLAMMALPLGFAIAALVWWPRPNDAR